MVNKVTAKHIYGLTATAYRRDKLDAVMFNSIGPIVAGIDHAKLFEDGRLMRPTIRRRQTGWLPPGSELMEYQDFMREMVHSKGRNEVIVQDVVKDCVPGNACIVLVSRTKHAEILTEMLKARGIRCEFLVSAVDVETPSNGKKKKKKKRLIPKKVRERITADFKSGVLQVLVATYDILMEGFNYRPLNRLYLATPVVWEGSVTQALGRIQRPFEGKFDSICYDYVDGGIAMFVRQADSRFFSVYEKMGMSVVEVI